jgi:hypothetical protein
VKRLFADLELQKQFLSTGYIQTPMLSNLEINYLLDEVNKLCPEDNFNPHLKENYYITYHCTSLDKNFDYRKKAFNLIKNVFEPYLKHFMPEFEILSCNFFIKPPYTGMLRIHQNWPVLDLDDTSVTLWCPLQDVDAHNGTLHLVPGSHKILPHIESIEATVGFPYFKDFEDALVEKYLQPMTLKAGECLIFDESLIHWTPANNSSKPRIAVQITAFPKDKTPVLYLSDKDHPDRFEKFEISPDFYLTEVLNEQAIRQRPRKSLGFVENKNRSISEEEFIQLLKQGDRIRQRIYGQEIAFNS